MRLTEAEKRLIQARRRKQRQRKPAPRKTAVKRKPNPALNQAVANLLWLLIVALILLMVVAK